MKENIIPETEEEFNELIRRLHYLITIIFRKRDGKTNWLLPNMDIFNYILKDILDKNNGTKEAYSFLEKMTSDYKYINTLNIRTLIGMTGIHIQENNHTYPQTITEFHDCVRNKIIPNFFSLITTEELTTYFIVQKLFEINGPYPQDSEKFVREFKIFIHKGYKENNKDLKERKSENFLNFYKNLYRDVLTFYGEWCTVKDLNLDELLVLNRLRNDQPTPGINLVVDGVVIFSEIYLGNTKNFPANIKNGSGVYPYHLYIINMVTGDLYLVKTVITKNRTEYTTNNRMRRVLIIDQENIPLVYLGSRIRLTGRIGSKLGYPIRLQHNGEQIFINSRIMEKVKLNTAK